MNFDHAAIRKALPPWFNLKQTSQTLFPKEATAQESFDLSAKYDRWIYNAGQSCLFRTGMAGVVGFGAGAFFSLLSTSLAYEDPMRNTPISQKTKVLEIVKETGRGLWRSGKSLGKVGLIYSAVECSLASYRAKYDVTNEVVSGGVAGLILNRRAGLGSMALGGLGFAGFSGAIALYMRSAPSEE